MQNTPQKINLRQSRDFGELFNASVKFLKQNLKPLLKCLFFIAGPFILISAIAGAFYQSNAFSFSSLVRNAGVLSNVFTPAYFILIIFSVLGSLVLMGTVYEFMLIYQEKGPGQVTLQEVGSRLGSDAWKIISTFLVFFFIALLLLVLLVLFIAGVGSASPALVILFALAFIVGMLLLGPPLIFLVSVTYLIRIRESLGVLESFGRARSLMRDNYWWTWLILVCAYLGVMVLSFVFALPQGLMQFLVMFNSIKGEESSGLHTVFMVVSSFCTFCSSFLPAIIMVICGFHYYSLTEQKEGTGLFERINEIGKKENDNIETSY